MSESARVEVPSRRWAINFQQRRRQSEETAEGDTEVLWAGPGSTDFPLVSITLLRRESKYS
jgi:hypothetical protein